MNKTISICATAALATLGVCAQAQEITGRVISSTPVVQQVQVSRQICDNQPVAVQQPRTGAGAAIGAIAGGAMGNAIGGGSGRAAATVLGLVGGAIVGDRVEGGPASVQNMQRCTTQTFYENRTVGYNVAYEYGGRQYTVQMPNDPGPTVQLHVSPVNQGSSMPLASSEGVSAPPGVPSVPAVVASSSTVVYPYYYPAAPAYPAYPVYPAYYPSYYPPVGVSLGFGFGFGGGGHRHHWR
jgi:uncharacterized protein YcfJ